MRNFNDRQRRLAQQVNGQIQAQVRDMRERRRVQVLPKKHIQTPLAGARITSNIRHRQSAAQMLLNIGQRSRQNELAGIVPRNLGLQ